MTRAAFETQRDHDHRELAERFANQRQTRTGAINELADLLDAEDELEYTIATGSPIPDMSGRDRYVLTCNKTFTTLADTLSYWETLPPGMSGRHFIVCRRVLPDDSAEWFKV